MTASPTFWSIDCAEGEPDLFVCMSCLNEVYRSKVPAACPNCGAMSAFEPFTLEAIKDWGTAELIEKAQQALNDTPFSTSETDTKLQDVPPSVNQPSS